MTPNLSLFGTTVWPLSLVLISFFLFFIISIQPGSLASVPPRFCVLAGRKHRAKALTWLSCSALVWPRWFLVVSVPHLSKTTTPPDPPARGKPISPLLMCTTHPSTQEPCSRVHLKARFQEEEAVCCCRAREQFERDEKSNPSGQNKSCGDLIVYSTLHKSLCKHKILQRTRGNSCET